MRALPRTARLAVALVATFAAASSLAAQQPSNLFTPTDALDITTWTINDLTDDGRFLATSSSPRRDSFTADFRRDGDPTYVRTTPATHVVIDTRTGAQQRIFSDRRTVRAMRWHADGQRLAMLVWNGTVFHPVVWDRTTNRSRTLAIPSGRYVAENSDLRWSGDGRQLVFTVHTDAWRASARETFGVMTGATNVFVQNAKDPFLAWDDIRRRGNLRAVVALDVATGVVRDQVPEAMVATYTLAEDGSAITYTRDIARRTDYDSFQSEAALHTRDASGSERVLRPSLKGTQLQWAEDGRRYAFSRDGRVYVGTVSDSSTRLIAGPAEPKKGETADTSKAARDRLALERFTVVRYSPTADAVLVSNKEGLWLADVATGRTTRVIAASDSNDALPRASVAAWSSDGRHLYLSTTSRQKWERGITRFDRSTGELRELIKDGRNYSGFRLSKDGQTVIMNVAQGNRPPDLYTADAGLTNMRRLVETNPQLASKRIGATQLVSYLDADGHDKRAVVYYPADYQKTQTYPTVFEIYEDYFDDNFDIRANVLTGAGYVVVKPSVDFDIGYPGEAWLKGATAAANRLIEMGVADSARLGVQGQSYGGYATNLLITQTNRFKAAVNISGKVDMISFYTDSPRLGVRNVNAAEKTQDRLGATMWEQPQKYVQHSAVMFADRIRTPLLLVTGALDSNVPADNTREMYYALRRLGREVTWVNYTNGGHGGGTATAEDFLDMHSRVLGFFDSKLKPAKLKVATN